MTDFSWRKRPEWWIRRDNNERFQLPEQDVVSWDFSYGTDYDYSTGTFRIRSAKGVIVLSNKEHHYEIGHDDVLITMDDLSSPITIQYKIGIYYLWEGVVIPSSAYQFTDDDTVTWQLRGRFWQLLQAPVSARQSRYADDNVTANIAPHDFFEDVVGVAKRYAGYHRER